MVYDRCSWSCPFHGRCSILCFRELHPPSMVMIVASRVLSYGHDSWSSCASFCLLHSCSWSCSWSMSHSVEWSCSSSVSCKATSPSWFMICGSSVVHHWSLIVFMILSWSVPFMVLCLTRWSLVIVVWWLIVMCVSLQILISHVSISTEFSVGFHIGLHIILYSIIAYIN